LNVHQCTPARLESDEIILFNPIPTVSCFYVHVHCADITCMMVSASAAVDPATDPVSVHLAAAQRAPVLIIPAFSRGSASFRPTGADAAPGSRPSACPVVSGAAPDFRQSLLGRQLQKQFVGDQDERRSDRCRHAVPIHRRAGDHGRTRIVAYSGGTAYNFLRSVSRFQAYIDTQKRFAKIAADAGATVMLSNHSEFDQGYMKARMISTMTSGEITRS